MGPIFNTAQFNGGGGAGSLPPSVTARTIIYDALRLLGVTRQGYGPTTESFDDGLRHLNYLVDSWNAERLMLPAAVRDTFSLVANQAEYVIGPGGDFDTSRPQAIDAAGLVSASGTEAPLTVLTRERWAAISSKSHTGTPTHVYSDDGFPTATVTLWPIPASGGDSLALYYSQMLAGFADLDTQYSFLPGYAKALTFNLAHQIAPMMAIHSKIPQPLLNHVAATAIESKAAIKIRNANEVLLDVDPALTSHRTQNLYSLD